jgi:hypothetical protein
MATLAHFSPRVFTTPIFFCCQVENNCQKERKNLNVGSDLKTSETCIMASTEDAP